MTKRSSAVLGATTLISALGLLTAAVSAQTTTPQCRGRDATIVATIDETTFD